MSRLRTMIGVLLLSGVLAGCAGGAGSPADDVTPTVACPEPVHGDLPATCAPFDPDAAMAENERYRDRRPVDPETQAALDELVPAVRSALEPLAAAATVPTAEAVVDAFATAGIPAAEVQTLAGPTGVQFGAAAGGGCVFGSVALGAVEIEAGGFIMDGGCLPMVGH